jgi:hypothetical protein
VVRHQSGGYLVIDVDFVLVHRLWTVLGMSIDLQEEREVSDRAADS